jgi:hypothetical protein
MAPDVEEMKLLSTALKMGAAFSSIDKLAAKWVENSWKDLNPKELEEDQRREWYDLREGWERTTKALRDKIARFEKESSDKLPWRRSPILRYERVVDAMGVEGKLFLGLDSPQAKGYSIVMLSYPRWFEELLKQDAGVFYTENMDEGAVYALVSGDKLNAENLSVLNSDFYDDLKEVGVPAFEKLGEVTRLKPEFVSRLEKAVDRRLPFDRNVLRVQALVEQIKREHALAVPAPKGLAVGPPISPIRVVVPAAPSPQVIEIPLFEQKIEKYFETPNAKPLPVSSFIGGAVKAYSSHGAWSTLQNIRNLEKERENEFPELKEYRSSTPALWVTFDKRMALRYLEDAEQWDRLMTDAPLTLADKALMEDIAEITLFPSDVVAWTDFDRGYLILRPAAAEQPKGKPLTEDDVLFDMPYRNEEPESLENIRMRLTKDGFDLSTLQQLLADLIKKKEVFEPKPGFYAWTESSEEEAAATEKTALEELEMPEEPEQTVYVKVLVEGGVPMNEEGKPKLETPQFEILATTPKEFVDHGQSWADLEGMWNRPIVGMFGVKTLIEILKEGEVSLDLVEDLTAAFGQEWEQIREALADNPPPFNKFAKFIIKWRPEDLSWTESAKHTYDTYNFKYSLDELKAMSKRDLQFIAKIKDLSTSGEEGELIDSIAAFVPYAGEEAVAPVVKRVERPSCAGGACTLPGAYERFNLPVPKLPEAGWERPIVALYKCINQKTKLTVSEDYYCDICAAELETNWYPGGAVFPSMYPVREYDDVICRRLWLPGGEEKVKALITRVAKPVPEKPVPIAPHTVLEPATWSEFSNIYSNLGTIGFMVNSRLAGKSAEEAIQESEKLYGKFEEWRVVRIPQGEPTKYHFYMNGQQGLWIAFYKTPIVSAKVPAAPSKSAEDLLAEEALKEMAEDALKELRSL